MWPLLLAGRAYLIGGSTSLQKGELMPSWLHLVGKLYVIFSILFGIV